MRFLYKLCLIVAIIVSSNQYVWSQADTLREKENYRKQSTTFPENQKPSGNYHYVGFQANQLLRQLLGSAGNADNPYLFAYSFNSVERGGGMNFGLGFSFQTIDDTDPTINLKRTTKSNNTAFRIGYDVKRSIGKRWIAGYGFDIFRNGGKSETKTTFTSGGPDNILTTKTNGLGIGPRFTLLFNVNEKIFLGTETTVYFIREKTTSKGEPGFPGSFEQELVDKSFILGVPTALFIMLRF